MPSPIEVITFDQQKTTELAEAVYHNAEPGFQIDGVRSYQELKAVFTALRLAVPVNVSRRLRFNDTFKIKPENIGGSGPHIDASYHGFAVHHNISDEVEVTLATVNKWDRALISNDNLDEDCFNDDELVRNVRRGFTYPGRITIFSEGNVAGLDKPFAGLLPTLHYFARNRHEGPHLWTRYTTAGSALDSLFGGTFRVKAVARKSFEQAEMFYQRQAA